MRIAALHAAGRSAKRRMRPDIIPGYRIERRIGRGGMASVYLAVQESLGRPVALKVLSNFDSAEYSERFLNEGRIVAQLTHAHIVTIHDIGIVDGLHYLSMEYVAGGDLRQRIKGGVTPAFALEVLVKIANALGLAHRRGVVHRDVKPANILFRDARTPLLTDFGIAKLLDRSQDVTLTGTILGSPDYMSPEQAQGQRVDARSDIYSLGVILYEMLTGTRPFTATSDINTIVKLLKEPLPRLPAALAAYQELLDRMTAKDLEARFKDIDALLAALCALPAAPSASPPSIPSPEPEGAGAGEDRTMVVAPATHGGPAQMRPRLLAAALFAAVALAATLYFLPPLTGPATGPTVVAANAREPLPSPPPAATLAPEAEALFQEAMAALSGEGADDAQTLKLLQQAATLGHPQAQYQLGRMQGQGRGTVQDYRQAVHWYLKAARRGVAEAQYSLCLSYALGRGAELDRVRAYAWCQIAVDHGSAEARESLEALQPYMNPARLKNAQALITELMAEIQPGHQPGARDDARAGKLAGSG